MKKSLLFLLSLLLVLLPSSVLMSGCFLLGYYYTIEDYSDIEGLDTVSSPHEEVDKFGKKYISKGSTKYFQITMKPGYYIPEEHWREFVKINGEYIGIDTLAGCGYDVQVYRLFYFQQENMKITFNHNIKPKFKTLDISLNWEADSNDLNNIDLPNYHFSFYDLPSYFNGVNGWTDNCNETKELYSTTVNYGTKYEFELSKVGNNYQDVNAIKFVYDEEIGGNNIVETKVKDDGRIVQTITFTRPSKLVISEEMLHQTENTVEIKYEEENGFKMFEGGLQLFTFTNQDDEQIEMADFESKDATQTLKVKCNLFNDTRLGFCYENLFADLKINGKTLSELGITQPAIGADGTFTIAVKRPYTYYEDGDSKRHENYRTIVLSANCIDKIYQAGHLERLQVRLQKDMTFDNCSVKLVMMSKYMVGYKTPTLEEMEAKAQERTIAIKDNTLYALDITSEEFYADNNEFYMEITLPENMQFVGFGLWGSKRCTYYLNSSGTGFYLKSQNQSDVAYHYFNSVENKLYVLLDGAIGNYNDEFSVSAKYVED